MDGLLKVGGRNDVGQLGDGTHDQKNTLTAVVCPSSCPPPMQLSANNITSGTATLNWASPTPVPAGGYLYFYSTYPFVGGLSGTTLSASANLTNLLSNTPYYWWVAAHCGSSQGNWISGGSFTTLPPTTIGCWESVSTGMYHSVGLKTDGSLWAWGYNYDGQLGDGTTISKNIPIRIGTDNNWLKIAAGSLHSLGLKTDGTLWSWGYNSNGELGDGTTTNKMTPAQIGTDTDWVSIAAGDFYTVALKSNGTLWAWGLNAHGQLGDGTNIGKTVPVQIGTANNWKTITPASRHTLAIKTDGTLWTWGYNVYGQLGDGSTSNKNTPTQIGTGTNWENVAGGFHHSIGLKTDGTLWAWGDNSSGQLGDGTQTGKLIPTQIGTATDWKSISADKFSSSGGIKTNGTFWGWGNNRNGQLGDGTNDDRFVPTQIGTATDTKSISINMYNRFVINNNGFLSSCGSNDRGQLGDGTNIPKIIFTPVSCPVSTLAVAEVSTKLDQLKVYPNPVQDILTVSLDQKIFMVTVYNTVGQVILTKAINDTKGTIDLSVLTAGVYLVKVSAANDFAKTVKVIKR
ncbi:T9SS type A sorting domain-containing protein [Chryseobacterium tructae]|nr:T9SS type A sorting domain-containing protein [Chryseobacterium tructae]MDN3692356.1 T9SS type A sorting domain-containing protein [Chryseobacterium tructae]